MHDLRRNRARGWLEMGRSSSSRRAPSEPRLRVPITSRLAVDAIMLAAIIELRSVWTARMSLRPPSAMTASTQHIRASAFNP